MKVEGTDVIGDGNIVSVVGVGGHRERLRILLSYISFVLFFFIFNNFFGVQEHICNLHSWLLKALM